MRQRVLGVQDIDLFITVNDIPTVEDYRLCWKDHGFIRRTEHWHLTSKITYLRVVSAIIYLIAPNISLKRLNFTRPPSDPIICPIML